MKKYKRYGHLFISIEGYSQDDFNRWLIDWVSVLMTNYVLNAQIWFSWSIIQKIAYEDMLKLKQKNEQLEDDIEVDYEEFEKVSFVYCNYIM